MSVKASRLCVSPVNGLLDHHQQTRSTAIKVVISCAVGVGLSEPCVFSSLDVISHLLLGSRWL